MTELGKYEVLEEIGRGGFAVVYKARDTELDRIVALKVLHPQLTSDPEFLQRFRQEAQVAARLRHPNIVTVYDVGEEAGQYYLAMAFLPGRTLDKCLAEGLLPVEQAVSVVEQLASALDTIHRQGLVHRDVKPGNIMVDDAGQATLLDFGIVRAAEGTQLTKTMTVLGTPEYMAPEQAEGQKADALSDVYSLGVVAYELCVGQVPFSAPTPLVVLRLQADKQPPSPRELNPHLSTKVEQVLLKVLSKDRKERYESAGEMAQALKEAVQVEQQARQQHERLKELYERIREAVEGEDWVTAEAQCREALALKPDYQDVPELWVRVREERARQQELDELYQQILARIESEDWAQAEDLCQRIQALAPGYRDVDRLLCRVEAAQSQKRAQEEHQTRHGRDASPLSEKATAGPVAPPSRGHRKLDWGFFLFLGLGVADVVAIAVFWNSIDLLGRVMGIIFGLLFLGGAYYIARYE